MRFLLSLPLLTAGVLADLHVNIPEIDSAVGFVLSKFHQYPAYHGPTGTATTALHTSKTPIPTSTPTCAPYWLETIKHQGVAAFNPNAGYQVFRNVKDFGAKG